ncbi:MAG: UDP-N-acetylmuramoyl-L-alanyl-D-glutamate--2,6-diaminopimelate ligase [Candidatus Berkelbacteria bacterium Licking1014_7]|uniref:UDP-N-acetylmuramoyl-L-alanyl-D-glutamate--2, 6-diaminopimelate ligase n=1 Tax=Candidatus Berkelbacteria bacterium Licking1014_7 TaxID=2017147 RepID=A0A554LKB5_9BACT|nr:MAG: UDP-N-acetylmuramoyl-L-alanyl-D-glutamate--2,6-diaminopimelate ligase [Candidatus Berkelbacteria bacterium Licking1014_7]
MLEKIKTILRPLVGQKFILWTHRVRARLANFVLGNPARDLKIIGVTGTNGKTTTCAFLGSILRETGVKVAEATTVYFRIGDKISKNNLKMTTISAWQLQKFLLEAKRSDCEYAVLEITSHALSQNRVWGINFFASVLTNITHDHLDYHKNFTQYAKTKLKLFEGKPFISVINLDDPISEMFLKQEAYKVITYGLGSKKPAVRASKIVSSGQGISFSLIAPQGQKNVLLKMAGKFNIYNALAAASVGLGIGMTLEGVKRGLEKVESVRGRFEKIKKGQPFGVILDYAHTPDAFLKIYEAVKPLAKKRIIAVFGATGNRDMSKRPILGEVASAGADVIILTDEDPYTENPSDIIRQVEQGIDKKKFILGKNFYKILDRKLAIRKAFEIATEGDLVLITGKGHEEMTAVANPRDGRLSILVTFNERKVVESELSALGFRK